MMVRYFTARPALFAFDNLAVESDGSPNVNAVEAAKSGGMKCR
jgi:hypothetical protein